MPVLLEDLHRSAVSALNRGDLRAMAVCCKQILEADRSHADAWFLLGIGAEAARDLPRAQALVEQAVSLAPGNAEYLAQKAKLHALLNQAEPARQAAQAALAAAPQRALVYDTLGVVFTRLGDHAQAVETLRRAVALAPDNAQFHFNLASAEQFLGRAQAARDHYLRAIELQPRFARAYWALAELEKNAPDERRESTLAGLFADPSLPPLDRLYIGHALARALEQRGAYAEAFNTLKAAKSARHRQLQDAGNADRAMFESVTSAFSQADSALRPLGRDWSPLFIVGMPRSGTTLVERMLAAHPVVDSLGELQDFPQVVKAASGDRSPRMLDAGVVAGALAATPGAIASAYRSAVEARLGRQPDGRFIVDKLPLNFLYLGFILRAFPAARILLVRRHPLDTIISNFRQLFAVNFSHYNYAYDLEDTARYYLWFDRLCRHWQALYGERIHAVNYEELVAAPREGIAAALDYLELPWSDDCLEFHRRDDAVTTASAMQVREPVYRSAVGRWKHYAGELAPVMALLEAGGVSWR